MREKTAKQLDENARRYNMRLSAYIGAFLEEKIWDESWENTPRISREIAADSKMMVSLVFQFMKEQIGEERARELFDNAEKMQEVNIKELIAGLDKSTLRKFQGLSSGPQ